MDMRLVEVQSIALNRACHSADEGDGPIRLDFLNDTDMGQGVVGLPVPIKIPGVVKKHKLTRPYIRSAMNDAIPTDMVVDEPNTVGVHLLAPCLIEVHSIFKEDGTGNSGTVVGDPFTLTGDRPGPDQARCGLNDSRSAGQ